MYRLMQLSNTPLPQAAMFTHLFYAQRNRVEFISDFPEKNEAEVIHSLQVHPQGWCILSRNTSMEDLSEVNFRRGFPLIVYVVVFIIYNVIDTVLFF